MGFMQTNSNGSTPEQGNTSGQFSDNNPTGPSAVPVPQASTSLASVPNYAAPIAQNQQTQATNKVAQATTQGDQSIANASQSSGSGTSPLSFLGPVASILGSIFNQGGVVGYASGGTVKSASPEDMKMIAAFLAGGIHQKQFGGTLDTIPQAANTAKQMLASKGINVGQANTAPPGFAQGGEVDSVDPNSNSQQQAVANAINQAMGLNNPSSDTQTQEQQTQSAPNDTSSSTIGEPLGGYQGMMNGQSGNSATQDMGMQNMASTYGQNPTQQVTQAPMMQAAGGPINKGFAQGGPQMPPQGQPPLQPGQTFQGDGSVKGPGTGQSDSIPAKLSNGEFVMSQPAVSFFGVDKLVKMNEQGKQGFMQAVGQVAQNQQQQPANGAPPQGVSPQGQAPSPQSQPQMAAKGGVMVSHKGSGYCGL